MYGMNNLRKVFPDESTEWLLDAGLIQYHCQMYIYYKYALDLTKNLVLSYVNECVYYYTSEALGKWFVGVLGKISNVNFLRYSH